MSKKPTVSLTACNKIMNVLIAFQGFANDPNMETARQRHLGILKSHIKECFETLKQEGIDFSLPPTAKMKRRSPMVILCLRKWIPAFVLLKCIFPLIRIFPFAKPMADWQLKRSLLFVKLFELEERLESAQVNSNVMSIKDDLELFDLLIMQLHKLNECNVIKFESTEAVEWLGGLPILTKVASIYLDELNSFDVLEDVLG